VAASLWNGTAPLGRLPGPTFLLAVGGFPPRVFSKACPGSLLPLICAGEPAVSSASTWRYQSQKPSAAYFGTPAQHRLGRLCQASIRGTGASLRLSCAPTPTASAISNRRLKSRPTTRASTFQVEGLSPLERRPERLQQGDDARYKRSSIRRFPDACLAIRPFHRYPLLWLPHLFQTRRPKNNRAFRERLAVPRHFRSMTIKRPAPKIYSTRRSAPRSQKAPEHHALAAAATRAIIGEPSCACQQPKPQATPSSAKDQGSDNLMNDETDARQYASTIICLCWLPARQRYPFASLLQFVSVRKTFQKRSPACSSPALRERGKRPPLGVPLPKPAA